MAATKQSSATYDALKALSDAASQGPWTHYCKAIPDAEEARAELASMVGTTEKAHGAVPSYDLHGVGYETDKFTLYTALTGCAPNSAANADFIVALVNAFRAGVPCVPSATERRWIPVSESLPEGKVGVPYMTFMTDPVLVLHKDRPDYPITAHAALGDDLDTLGVRIPTNGASKYKWISWHSIGRDGSNPFDLAGLRDAYGYERKMPNYLGYGITHWMPLREAP